MPAPAWCAGNNILVLGDSLSASYNIELSQGWVQLLQQRLVRQGYEHAVVNASISGETTAGGLNRLPRALALHQPVLVLVELGGNDGLRGLSLGHIRENLSQIIALSRQAGAAVVLCGIRIPPNYGPDYTEAFGRIYEELGRLPGVYPVPFILEGIALEPGMMQADGIHPGSAAQARMLDNVWPAIESALKAHDRHGN